MAEIDMVDEPPSESNSAGGSRCVVKEGTADLRRRFAAALVDFALELVRASADQSRRRN